jgi:hypothetical protein
MIYPAITLWQPWASWIAWGWKTIETRTHDRFRCLAGKRIAIHAGLGLDGHAHSEARRWMTHERWTSRMDWESERTFPRGEVVCVATVAEARWLTDKDSVAALIDCGEPNPPLPSGAWDPRFGLVLTNVVPVSGPRCKGGRGIFRVEMDA